MDRCKHSQKNNLHSHFYNTKTLQIISVSNNMQLTEGSHIDLKKDLNVAIKTDGSQEH